MSNNWLATDTQTLPDFIIMGAMKSGTTTLHAMLNSHPCVHIPDDELFFFSGDDIAEHPDLPKLGSLEARWQWYQSKLHPSSSLETVVGEDSTTYLASERAIRRIAQQPKPIKCIIMLRQPSLRAYSQYWHAVRAGRALFSFEDTLKYIPQTLLSRSQYFQQLNTLYRYIAPEHIKVVLFEEFIQSPLSVLSELAGFLNLDDGQFPQGVENIHENTAQLPKHINLHLLKSRLFRASSAPVYEEHFSLSPQQKHTKNWLNAAYKVFNPMVTRRPPKMREATKVKLDTYFQSQFKGLDSLIGKPVNELWFGHNK